MDRKISFILNGLKSLAQTTIIFFFLNLGIIIYLLKSFK
jgi:hypothetical protein